MNLLPTPLWLRVGLLSLILTVPALAHIARIEPTPTGQLVIVFGEPGEKPEVSPGRLDQLSHPMAWLIKHRKPIRLLVTKATQNFVLTGASTANVVLAETRYPAFKRGSGATSWPQFYQRWHPSRVSETLGPGLTFDIVPIHDLGKFRVYFRGEPLAGVEVGVDHMADGIGANLISDADGIISYATDQPGLVIMTANYKEPLAGFTRGQSYEVISHNTALTWAQPSLTSFSK